MSDAPENPDRFDLLCREHGGDDLIPNPDLYRYLLSVREDLLNVASLGIDHIRNSRLGKEVRRRCQVDLMWLARYFLWCSNPASDNGLRPFEENIFDEEFYLPFVKLFVQKDPSKAINKQSEVKNRLLLWPRGGAKALDLETPIPTPTGLRRMGDLQVGDYVYGETGQPVPIVRTSEVFYDHSCYEVEFSTGETIVADEGHLWLTDAKRDRENKPRSLKRGSPSPSAKTTKEISETLFCRQERNHRVTVSQPILGAPQNLPIPPYALGCWLGDGTSASAQITCDEKDSQIIEEIRKEGVPVTKTSTYLRWSLNGGPEHPDFRKQKSGFTSKLRNMGLLRNKHIPAQYLTASIEQRLSLLQGLMDTDGTITPDGKCYFCNTNELLVEQTKQLIASLGFKPSISQGDATLDGVVIGNSYKVFFQAYSDRPVFRLHRKKARQVSRKKVSLQNHRTIVSVKQVASRPVKCIMVDSPSHLYLAGEGFIPTHNSTFDHVDTVQWILCFPAIRILYLTAEKSLAEGFVGEIKGHFYIKEDPSWMNLFWPEFCVEDTKAGAMNEFTCPVYAAKKTGRKEPTVYASSVGKSKAGWRYELIKADDAVSDTNSETSLLCSKISRALFLAEKLLALGGYYIDFIGTRYASEDHYGVLLDKNLGDITTTRGVGWEFMENRTTNTNILIGRAIHIKPEVKEQLEREGRPVTYFEAGPDGCVLLLPHLMSFTWCMGDLTKDEKSFEGQRNQNPRTQGDVVFDRMQLVRATIPFNLLPRQGPISQFWDLSFSQKKGTDFCVGSSVVWGEEDVYGPDGKPVEFSGVDGQKIREKKTVGYVRKLIRDRFNPFTVAQAIVQLVVEERPFILGIEKAGGSELLKPAIEAEALKTRDPYIVGICSNIDWVTPDNQNDAKRIRMGSLLPWVLDGRLKFLNACMQPKYPDLEVLYSEFEKCMTDHHHDDIPDNLGYQPRYAPRATQALINNETDMFGQFERAGWNEIYNEGRGQAYYPDENGKLTPWEQQPTNFFDDFVPEQEQPEYNYFGVPGF